MSSPISTAQDAVTDAVAATAELVDDLAPDLADVVESAVDTVASTSRFTIRLLTGVIRFVARRPKEVLVGIAIVAVVAGAVTYLSKSSSDANA